MSYEYKTLRQRRVRFHGTCSWSATYLFGSKFVLIKSAIGEVLFQPSNSGYPPANQPGLRFGPTITTTSSGSPSFITTVTVKGPSGAFVPLPGDVIDTFTVAPGDDPVTKTYSGTESYEFWCDVEEVLSQVLRNGIETEVRTEKPRIGGTRGCRISGNTFTETITSANVNNQYAWFQSADTIATMNVFTSSARALTGNRGEGGGPYFSTNYGVAIGNVGDYAGGASSGSITLAWEGADAVYTHQGNSQTLVYNRTKSVTRPTTYSPSAGDYVTVNQSYDVTVAAGGSSISVSGVPIPTNLARQGHNDTPPGSESEVFDSPLGENTASGRLTHRVQAYKLFDETLKVVGPSGQIISDAAFTIDGSTSFPPLSTTNGMVTWQRREGGNDYQTSVLLFADGNSFLSHAAYKFPGGSGQVQRPLAPTFSSSSANFAGEAGSLLGHKWQRLFMTPLAAERYLFGKAGKPFPGWQSIGFNVTVSNESGNLRIVTGSSVAATAGAQLPDDLDLDYRYARIRFRSVNAASRPLVLKLAQPAFGATADDLKVDSFALTTGASAEWVEVLIDRLAPYKAIALSRGRTYVDTEKTLPDPASAADKAIAEYDRGRVTIQGLSPSTTYEIAWLRFERTSAAIEAVFFGGSGSNLEPGNVAPPVDGLFFGADGKRSKFVYPDDTDASQNNNTPPAYADNRGWLATRSDVARTDKPDGSSTAYRPITDYYDSDYYITTVYTVPLGPGDGTQPYPIQVQQAFASRNYTSNGQERPGPNFEVNYPGAGDVFGTNGLYGVSIPLEWVYVTGRQIRGAVVGTGTNVGTAEIASGSYRGGATPAFGNYYATQAPYLWQPVDHEAFLVDKGSSYKGKLWGSRRYWFVTESKRGGKDSLAHPWGYYAFVQTRAEPQRIAFRRTVIGVPDQPSAWLPESTVVQGEVSFPCLHLDASGRLWARWEASEGIRQAISDDDGATWRALDVAIPNGKMPQIGRPIGGSDFPALGVAWVEVSGGVGKLQGQYLSAGSQTWGALFTFQEVMNNNTLAELHVTDAGYDLVQMSEGQARWVLSAVPEGQTDVAHWVSADEGQTWRKLAG